ncbi:MAG: RNA methyltransferase [Chloroflexi bacterium]|nr:RNA methyltransferase [Chloroflexota bacterium]
MITSRSNPKIKQIRALRQHKKRASSRLFLIEGIRHVGEAISAGAAIEYILYSPELITSDFAQELIQSLPEKEFHSLETTPDIFKSLSDKDNPQGLIAVAQQETPELSVLEPANFSWGVALVAPQDPGNVGTILRTVDALGASGLLLLENSVDVFHPKAVRASMGSLLWLPVVKASFTDFTKWTRKHSYHVYGTSATRGKDLTNAHNFEKPAILLMGSERQGLAFEHSAICEQLIRLPMKGHSTSLNLAVAAGILLYDMSTKLRGS